MGAQLPPKDRGSVFNKIIGNVTKLIHQFMCDQFSPSKFYTIRYSIDTRYV